MLSTTLDPNNRLVASQYDAVGNQTQDAAGNTFGYNLDNLQTSFNGAVATYSYDGEGRRVKKTDASGTTIFVYNAAGQLIAEYSDVPASGPGGTSYLTADHLGSARVITGAGGSVKKRFDYLPFGEEIPCSIGGRCSAPGYSYTDNTQQKFTGKERDAESGLDYFLARYFSGPQGRFTSPDAMLAKKEWLADPQRWNRYGYVRNNPLRFIDPNGEDLVIYTFYGSDLTEEQKKFLQENVKKIQAAIAEKFKRGGVQRVEFRDATSLTPKQIREIQKETPAGVALLGFVNRSVDGRSLREALGGTDPAKATSVVGLGNIVKGSLITPPSRDDSTTIFRAAEVGSHELGHALRFESNRYINLLTAGLADFVRSNIMDEGQGVPTRAKFFDSGADRNRRVIEEINKIGDNTPKP